MMAATASKAGLATLGKPHDWIPDVTRAMRQSSQMPRCDASRLPVSLWRRLGSRTTGGKLQRVQQSGAQGHATVGLSDPIHRPVALTVGACR